MQKTLALNPSLVLAFELYLFNRDHASKEVPFDKEKYRKLIFDEAKAVFGDSMVAAESIAASYFFHIKEGDKVSVWETHLTEQHRKEFKDFTILQYSFLNHDFEEAPPVIKKKTWLQKLFRR